MDKRCNGKIYGNKTQVNGAKVFLNKHLCIVERICKSSHKSLSHSSGKILISCVAIILCDLQIECLIYLFHMQSLFINASIFFLLVV